MSCESHEADAMRFGWKRIELNQVSAHVRFFVMGTAYPRGIRRTDTAVFARRYRPWDDTRLGYFRETVRPLAIRV